MVYSFTKFENLFKYIFLSETIVRVYLICFLSLGGHFPLLPNVQCLETVILYIFIWIFGCFPVGKVYPVAVIPSLPEAKALSLGFYEDWGPWWQKKHSTVPQNLALYSNHWANIGFVLTTNILSSLFLVFRSAKYLLVHTL